MRSFLWVLPMLPSLALAVSLFYTLSSGFKQADDGIKRPSHRRTADWTVVLTGVSLASMLLGDYFGLMPKVDLTVLIVHLGCTLAYIVLVLVLYFGITGLRHRLAHIMLGCVMTAVVLFVAITGIVMTGQAIAASL